MKSAIRVFCFFLLTLVALASQDPIPEWSLDKVLQVLNASPWARQETYIRIISGVGSGVSGEKEIFNTFYIRFISAEPVREALARMQQIQYGYDGLTGEEKQTFDAYASNTLLADFGDWIVVAVSFRSNDPNEESSVRRFFERETAETIKNKAFLSTEQFSQVRIHTYFPPRDEGIGAKFVFPRAIDGIPVGSGTDKFITFELLDVPAAGQLRARFAIKDMIVEGKVIL